MSNANDETAPSVDNESFSNERKVGRVKWFNNRAGFGFLTVLDGDKKNEDIFVHHSSIEVATEQYKYLVQGEYVNMILEESNKEGHKYQACKVHGIHNGKLMCETRRDNKYTIKKKE